MAGLSYRFLDIRNIRPNLKHKEILGYEPTYPTIQWRADSVIRRTPNMTGVGL